MSTYNDNILVMDNGRRDSPSSYFYIINKNYLKRIIQIQEYDEWGCNNNIFQGDDEIVLSPYNSNVLTQTKQNYPTSDMLLYSSSLAGHVYGGKKEIYVTPNHLLYSIHINDEMVDDMLECLDVDVDLTDYLIKYIIVKNRFNPPTNEVYTVLSLYNLYSILNDEQKTLIKLKYMKSGDSFNVNPHFQQYIKV